MIQVEEMEQRHLAFLHELYTRSAGDPSHGVPYEELVEALGFDEPLTKKIQHDLQEAALVELTAVPRITTLGYPVQDYAHRRRSRETIAITLHGVRLMEDILSSLAHGGVHGPMQAAGVAKGI
jgi:hypothetical protein